MAEQHPLRSQSVQLLEGRSAGGLIPSVVAESRLSEAEHIPGRLAADDRRALGGALDEHRLVPRRMPGSRNDTDAVGDLLVPIDHGVVDALRERPFRHGVVRSLRGFELSLLDDDAGAPEPVVLAAVVKVKV